MTVLYLIQFQVAYVLQYKRLDFWQMKSLWNMGKCYTNTVHYHYYHHQHHQHYITFFFMTSLKCLSFRWNYGQNMNLTESLIIMSFGHAKQHRWEKKSVWVSGAHPILTAQLEQVKLVYQWELTGCSVVFIREQKMFTHIHGRGTRKELWWWPFWVWQHTLPTFEVVSAFVARS